MLLIIMIIVIVMTKITFKRWSCTSFFQISCFTTVCETRLMHRHSRLASLTTNECQWWFNRESECLARWAEFFYLVENLNGSTWCAAGLASLKVALYRLLFGWFLWHWHQKWRWCRWRRWRWRWWRRRRWCRRRWWRRRLCNQSLAHRAQLLLHLGNLPVVSELLQNHPAQNCYNGKSWEELRITTMMTMLTLNSKISNISIMFEYQILTSYCGI